MSISAIPDHILVKIFCHLSISDQFLMGKVSKRFHRISLSAICQTRCIDISDDESLQWFSNRKLEHLLDLCSKNVRRIVSEHEHSYPLHRCQLDSEFVDSLTRPVFPRLTSLHICCIGTTDQNLREIIQNSPNLEDLRWKAYDGRVPDALPTIFPDVHCEKLRSLRIGACTDSSIRSLVGRCPNLKEFETSVRDPNRQVQTWDQFFATHPHLELLKLNGSQSDFDWTRMENFWRLSSLTHLTLNFISILNGNGCLAAIAASFKNLRHLDIGFLRAASDGIKTLCSLVELRTFRMTCFRIENIEEGIHRMALNCRHLESFNMPSYTPTPITFIHLIRFCPKLKVLKINSVNDADIPQAAAALLKTLSGKLQPRRIKIDMTIDFLVSNYNDQDYVLGDFVLNEASKGKGKRDAWNSEQVKDALKGLEEEGVIIELRAIGRPVY